MFLSFLFRKKNPKDEKLRKQLEKILGFKPKEILYYKMALRHASANQKQKEIRYNNERLEFLGDSVISTIASVMLYEKYPQSTEGELSVLRSMLVSRKSLNRVANELQLKRLMQYKEGRTNEQKNITGNSFEALVGAIFFDKGYAVCDKFVRGIFEHYFDVENLMKHNSDYKSRLLQYSQKEKFALDIDTFESMEACEKLYHFVTEICIDGKFMASGKGWTKKEAEQMASYEVLKILGREL
ncbi:MAG: ribonuclease III [Bacteroidales bacterium]|jgi:ribonuclease-3|nr:ribonuclease III [Bacteroidales bacterium]MBR3947185.1 ribonuclease III [Bacteroidales bacterium]